MYELANAQLDGREHVMDGLTVLCIRHCRFLWTFRFHVGSSSPMVCKDDHLTGCSDLRWEENLNQLLYLASMSEWVTSKAITISSCVFVSSYATRISINKSSRISQLILIILYVRIFFLKKKIKFNLINDLDILHSINTWLAFFVYIEMRIWQLNLIGINYSSKTLVTRFHCQLAKIIWKYLKKKNLITFYKY